MKWRFALLILSTISFKAYSQTIPINTYYDFGKKYIKQSCSKDIKTQKLQGVYKEYRNLLGGVTVTGKFNQGRKVGEWKYYEPFKLELFKIENYNNKGQLHGKFVWAKSAYGTIDVGNYVNGEKDGDWFEYYGKIGGRVIKKETYKNGYRFWYQNYELGYGSDDPVADKVPQIDSAKIEHERIAIENLIAKRDSIKKANESERLNEQKLEDEIELKTIRINDIKGDILHNFKLNCKRADYKFNEREFTERVEYYNDPKYIDNLKLSKHNNISNAIKVFFIDAYFTNKNYGSLDKELEIYTNINEIIKSYNECENKSQLNKELENIAPIEDLINVFLKYLKK